MNLPQASRTSCRYAHPLAAGDTGGPAKPVPRRPANGPCRLAETAALAKKVDLAGKNVAVVASGGNADPEVFVRALAGR